MNVNKLKGKLVEQEKNAEWVAKVLKCDVSTVYRKLASFEKLSIGEAATLKIQLNMTDAEAHEIFL